MRDSDTFPGTAAGTELARREYVTHPDVWPPLPYAQWRETCEGLHLRTQIAGKIRVAQIPWLNHSWHVTLQLTARGLTSGPIPYGERFFQIDFDFVEHQVQVRSSDGNERDLPLAAQPIADFYAAVFDALESCGIRLAIHRTPSEMPDAVAFDEDRKPRAYDRDAAERFWRVLVQVDRILDRFRTGFIGKASPVHFFWGSFDLAATRFSGRLAPRHPGGVARLPDAVTREAYSHEVCSAGFWPGAGLGYPAFYCYAYPEPAGFRAAPVRPGDAFYSESLREFVLPYDAVRAASHPEEVLLSFLQSTYEAAAVNGRWDRAMLECPLGEPRVPRRCNVPAAQVP